MTCTEIERHDGCSRSNYSEEATLNFIFYATHCPENLCGASLLQLILQIGATKYEVSLKNIMVKFLKMLASVLISFTIPVSSCNHWQLLSCSHIIRCF
jgi:hypothetical protein